MQAFFNTARVQVDKEGLYFYERDIIMSPYLFNRNVKIDINLLYKRSGFGVIIAENSPINPKHSYLYHLGTNDFIVYERHLLQQTEYSSRANIVAPNGQVHLLFTLDKQKGRFYVITTNDEGKEKQVMIGEHTISRKLSTYYLGFYSQAGNIINDITFLQGIPDRWHCSIANVHGGRISFWDDGFMFEDCVHDAELEQKEIILPKGKYWFNYETATVNGKYDIEGFIYESTVPSPPSDTTDRYYDKKRDTFEETYLEDLGKALVHNQGSFQLNKDTSVIVSFKGRNGRVNYVCLKDTQEGSYVSTEESSKSIDGSWIVVDLTNVIAIKWEGIIFSVPPYEDMSKPCPYAVMATNSDRVQLEALSIDTDKEYSYYYDVGTSQLEAIDPETEMFHGYRTVKMTASDNNKIKIFMNMSAQITNFTLIMQNSSEINVNVQKTYKVFVPGYIKGPIIVTDKDKNSFDISGSYREVIDDDNFIIDLFSKTSLELKLSHHTSTLWQSIKVYGISRSATIDKTKTDIQSFASEYTEISDDLVFLKNDVIDIPSEIRDDYDYIAVRYQSIEDYSYFLTVYGRELFSGTENLLKLSADINESGQGITVYGIYQNCLNEDYILRVPNKGMLNTIDICASRYDMISPTKYEVNTFDNIIRLNSDLNDIYEYYIVDYMKKNSYAINWNDQGQQYEVDISSDESVMEVHYEMDSNGNSNNLIRTKIKPDNNKFIILRRQKGAFS